MHVLLIKFLSNEIGIEDLSGKLTFPLEDGTTLRHIELVKSLVEKKDITESVQAKSDDENYSDLVVIYLNLGSYYENQTPRNIQAAIESYQQAITISQKIKTKTKEHYHWLASLHNRTGSCHACQAPPNFQAAMQSFQQSITSLQAIEIKTDVDNRKLARTHSNIGHIYREQIPPNFQAAMQSFQQSINFLQKIELKTDEDCRQLAAGYSNIGFIYQDQTPPNLQTAIESFQQAISFLQKIEFKTEVDYYNLACNFRLMGKCQQRETSPDGREISHAVKKSFQQAIKSLQVIKVKTDEVYRLNTSCLRFLAIMCRQENLLIKGESEKYRIIIEMILEIKQIKLIDIRFLYPFFRDWSLLYPSTMFGYLFCMFAQECFVHEVILPGQQRRESLVDAFKKLLVAIDSQAEQDKSVREFIYPMIHLMKILLKAIEADVLPNNTMKIFLQNAENRTQFRETLSHLENMDLLRLDVLLHGSISPLVAAAKRIVSLEEVVTPRGI